ncbi:MULTISPECIES: FGGY-family carbohydrate kinase [unclassified Rhizobium]|mgnify:CR=1 FL=1|jgi:D-ribulokinase|uniref:FGGY-family carbohydrate kinase n=1 Tax=unclassified Rhizobium TaxID=2613769 RepID=UPI000648054C|nr:MULTISPECIES: FGGY-family carbohydrate kinase [unclassified Rhizobium]MBN8952840.1 FGGY-family carbohydrate kinase [Rhizobium tropici]OJY76638.1 MAG: ribulokinase [Rhizobium sp. 60-20]RKD52564.1 FGGY-family pentulose kinase [Rhizobium sp. WW_1]
MTAPYFIGIDVGTGSARAGIFDAHGHLLAAAKRPITIWHEAGSIVEQSSEQIWRAVCDSVKEAVATAKVAASDVAGIGFDATCSLVAVKADGEPVAVGPSGDADRNIIVWMDHRAAGEAAEINAGDHAALRYVGGRISPEMETPKLLWLKRKLPQSFAATDHFFDLADYLTWRATGSLQRSVCTVTCKWTYLAHEKRWDAAYFKNIGLGELADEGFVRIGTEIVEPGTGLGEGLNDVAARDLGLAIGTPVGASLIDAHAGGVGTLGGQGPDGRADVKNRLAYIFGTSACSMASSEGAVFVDGVWGPYFSAMVPGLWLTEGGQSAAGAAIDHLVSMHPATGEARQKAEAEGLSLVAWLDRQAVKASGSTSDAVKLAQSIQVVPEFLGNRSPYADPDARAVISGLGLETGIEDLVALYVAGLCGIGYGLKQLLEKLGQDGIDCDLIIASGGAAQSGLVRQLLADTTGRPVAVADTEEPVLLGAAMLGATAGGHCGSLVEAMATMSRLAKQFEPADGAIKTLHERRYEAFELLQSADRSIRALMAS